MRDLLRSIFEIIGQETAEYICWTLSILIIVNVILKFTKLKNYADGITIIIIIITMIIMGLCNYIGTSFWTLFGVLSIYVLLQECKLPAKKITIIATITMMIIALIRGYIM